MKNLFCFFSARFLKILLTKNLFALLTLIFLILPQYACDTTEPPYKIEPQLKLELEDVSCVEAWINIKTDNIKLPVWLYTRVNDAGINLLILYTNDTLIYNSGYLPNIEYTYKVSTSSQFYPDSTSKLTFRTLDTTLQNFTWSLDTLGSTQSDITGIWGSNSNNIWAVGTFTSQNPTSLLAHYDGNKWAYLRPPNFHGLNGIQAGNLMGIYESMPIIFG